ncbi:unnamed protein product [Symbiodinium sp. CCMP2592]|nr:unnamed protein product [Symbiodinium sp. CCMP2592]
MSAILSCRKDCRIGAKQQSTRTEPVVGENWPGRITGPFQAVHRKKDFCSKLAPMPRGFSELTGTQCFDRAWQSLKAFIPGSIRHRLRDGLNPELRKWTFQWCYRHNHVQGKLPKIIFYQVLKFRPWKN